MPNTSSTRTKSKRRSGGKKGTPFERRICKELSLWWTNGDRDDVFWRTATSGGRATQRAKTKRGTFGQEGDVQATDPIGQPLMDVFAIELKRGYQKTTIQDLFDYPVHNHPGTGKPMLSQMELFIKQAKEAKVQGRTKAWMLIQQRDRRDAVLLFPKLQVFSRICISLAMNAKHYTTMIYTSHETKRRNIIVVTTWNDFRNAVGPHHIHDLYR